MKATRQRSFSPLSWLLLLPLAGLLFPAFYSRATPALFGFPFFYWYQVAWVLITAALTAAVYLAGERR